jgi:hypothetical protein
VVLPKSAPGFYAAAGRVCGLVAGIDGGDGSVARIDPPWLQWRIAERGHPFFAGPALSRCGGRTRIGLAGAGASSPYRRRTRGIDRHSGLQQLRRHRAGFAVDRRALAGETRVPDYRCRRLLYRLDCGDHRPTPRHRLYSERCQFRLYPVVQSRSRDSARPLRVLTQQRHDRDTRLG